MNHLVFMKLEVIVNCWFSFPGNFIAPDHADKDNLWVISFQQSISELMWFESECCLMGIQHLIVILIIPL